MCKQIYIYVKFLSIRIKCQTFCSVLKIYVQFYTYLFIMEPNLALEQYPCKCTESFFKKSCFLSCFTEIYSPLKEIQKSHSPLFPDTSMLTFHTKFQIGSKSVFRTTDQLVRNHNRFFFFFFPRCHSTFSPIFQRFPRKKRKKRKNTM